eukprot:6172428-Pleurochrysis_carterae.AAC.6
MGRETGRGSDGFAATLLSDRVNIKCNDDAIRARRPRVVSPGRSDAASEVDFDPGSVVHARL